MMLSVYCIYKKYMLGHYQLPHSATKNCGQIPFFIFKAVILKPLQQMYIIKSDISYHYVALGGKLLLFTTDVSGGR